MLDKEQIVKLISDRFSGDCEILELNPPQAAIKISAVKIVSLFEFIISASELKLNYLSSISGVDYQEYIEIVYFVSSIEYKHKLTIKVQVERQGGQIDSISSVLKGANWFEREIWELFGVQFNNHDNLTRFLLPEDWDQGYPMLKDWEGKDFEKMPEDV